MLPGLDRRGPFAMRGSEAGRSIDAACFSSLGAISATLDEVGKGERRPVRFQLVELLKSGLFLNGNNYLLKGKPPPHPLFPAIKQKLVSVQ